jgi:hypothetical protein
MGKEAIQPWKAKQIYKTRRAANQGRRRSLSSVQCKSSDERHSVCFEPLTRTRTRSAGPVAASAATRRPTAALAGTVPVSGQCHGRQLACCGSSMRRATTGRAIRCGKFWRTRTRTAIFINSSVTPAVGGSNLKVTVDRQAQARRSILAAKLKLPRSTDSPVILSRRSSRDCQWQVLVLAQTSPQAVSQDHAGARCHQHRRRRPRRLWPALRLPLLHPPRACVRGRQRGCARASESLSPCSKPPLRLKTAAGTIPGHAQRHLH